MNVNAYMNANADDIKGADNHQLVSLVKLKKIKIPKRLLRICGVHYVL